MPRLPRTLSLFRTGLLATVAVVCSSGSHERAGRGAPDRDVPAQPPLEIKFTPAEGLGTRANELACEVPRGRTGVYDPATGVFHVHFKVRNLTRGGFEVTRIAGKPAKPVVFRLTGVPSGFGCLGEPLTLTVGEKKYALDPSCAKLYWREPVPFDRTLFRSAREGEEVTIEFTEKGLALLKPGARIGFEVDTGW